MKIVHLSDTHETHRLLTDIPDGDVLVFSGDITLASSPEAIMDFNEWLGTLEHPYKIVIAGNHDRLLDGKLNGYKMITNAIYLQNQTVEIDGLNFYGSPFTPLIPGLEHYYGFGYNRAVYTPYSIPEDTDILITHGPPHGILDFTKSGFHVGCELLIGRVAYLNPRFHLFGHIHEGYGLYRAEYGTTYVNSALLDEFYRLKNKPQVLYT